MNHAMTSTTRLADSVSKSIGPPKVADELLTVTFWIGRQRYALPVSVVIEIVWMVALTPLAGAPPIVIGLLNLRGRSIPVLDGSILVAEVPRYRVDDQIVIMGCVPEAGALLPRLGLRVERVIGVHPLHQRQMTNLDSSFAAPFLRGVANTDEGSIIVLDGEAILKMVPDPRP